MGNHYEPFPQWPIWLTAISLVLLIVVIVQDYSVGVEYVRRYKSSWNLGEKASSIEAKREKVEAFVKKLDEGRLRGEFADNNAIFFPTPDNEFESNIEMLRTLEKRLGEISAMDPKSFEYNTAIEQITKQEQGEANNMLSVIEGCWRLRSHPFYWGWISVAATCTLIVGLVVGGVFLLGEMADRS